MSSCLYFLLAGGVLRFVRTGAGGCGKHQELGTLCFAPQALVQVGSALDCSIQLELQGALAPFLTSMRATHRPVTVGRLLCADHTAVWVTTYSFERWELFPALVPAQILFSFSLSSSEHFCSLLLVVFSRKAIFSFRAGVSTSEVWQHESTERW